MKLLIEAFTEKKRNETSQFGLFLALSEPVFREFNLNH